MGRSAGEHRLTLSVCCKAPGRKMPRLCCKAPLVSEGRWGRGGAVRCTPTSHPLGGLAPSPLPRARLAHRAWSFVLRCCAVTVKKKCTPRTPEVSALSFVLVGGLGSASEVCHCLGGSQYRKDKRQPLHALGGRLGSLQVSVAILAQERARALSCVCLQGKSGSRV